MEAVVEQIGAGGVVHIPPQLLKKLHLAEGDKVYLRAEQPARLVIVPTTARKRVRLDAQIVDELVENEALFEPETV